MVSECNILKQSMRRAVGVQRPANGTLWNLKMGIMLFAAAHIFYLCEQHYPSVLRYRPAARPTPGIRPVTGYPVSIFIC